MKHNSQVLLIGPLPISGDVIGGTKVLFANLVDDMTSRGHFDLEVHNTSRAQLGRGRARRALNNVFAICGLLWFLVSARRPDLVFFNTSSGGALLSGPLVWALCKIRQRPLVLRVFGGDIDLFFERSIAPLRWLARKTILRADRVLLETRALCEQFAPGAEVNWWPNTREMQAEVTECSATALRFLFLGQLRREKGLCEALSAARQLPEGATLSIYGPPMIQFDSRQALEQSACYYGGALAPDQVEGVLAAHDVLVFPSYHAGEGMPGVVIEAMQMGMPVIATRWRALEELVEDGKNGLLVEVRNASALSLAMTRMANDPELYRRLCRGAKQTGDRFRIAPWSAWLEQELACLCGESPACASPCNEVA